MNITKNLTYLLIVLAAFTGNITGACTPITQADIPLTITTPGDYCFASDLTFAGPGNAITVAVGAVNIDLQGYQLSQGSTALTTVASASDGQMLPQATINVASTDGFPTNGEITVQTSNGVQTVAYKGTTATSFTGAFSGTGNMASGNTVNGYQNGVNGIYVSANLINVNIFNGTVSGFTRRGIWYDQGTRTFYLNNLIVQNCGAGFTAAGAVQGTGIFLGPNVATTDPSQIAIYVSNVTVTNSTIVNNGQGLNVRGNDNIYFDNVRCNNSLSINAQFAGIDNGNQPIPVQEEAFLKNLRIYNSTFNSAQGLGSRGFGGSLLLNPHIKGCTFNDNKVGSIVISGGYVDNGSVNALFEDNQFNNNIFVPPFPGAVPLYFGGFHTSGNVVPGLAPTTTLTLRNNEAHGNISPGFVYGLLISYRDNVVMENNKASRNRTIAQQPDAVTGTIRGIPCAAGIYIDSSNGVNGQSSDLGLLSQSIFRNNVASDNIAEQGLGVGLYIMSGAFLDPNLIQKNLALHGNIMQGNVGLADSPPIFNPPFLGDTTYPGAKGIGAGILEDRGIILNPDNNTLGAGKFPAAALRNLCIERNCLQGNLFGVEGADSWSALVPYDNGDVVAFEGTVYKSLQNSNLNNQPASSPAFWVALLPATGAAYSGGLVLIGADSATVTENEATGNTNGFVLTGGTNWAGVPIASTSNVLVQNNQAVRNSQTGFLDAQVGVSNGKNLNAFVENTAFNNGCNYAIKKDANIDNISIPSTKSSKKSR